MIRLIVFLTVFFTSYPLHSQPSSAITTSATYYESGINSPWAIGFDYDFGFLKVMSFNIQFTGGITSQVNRASTFGDVFMGEFQIGPRVYMNAFDTWSGLYFTTVGRLGFYNVPFRTQTSSDTESASTLIINRADMLLYGVGIYIGYKWKRPLVTNMKDFHFTMILEPYMGWGLDFLVPMDSSFDKSDAIHRFSVGLSFKVGFYTYIKSKVPLEESEESSTEESTTPSTEAPQQ